MAVSHFLKQPFLHITVCIIWDWKFHIIKYIIKNLIDIVKN